MLDRAARHGLGVDELQLAPVDDVTVMNGSVHDSSGGIYRSIQRTPRAMHQRRVARVGVEPAHFVSESRADPMHQEGAAVTR